MTMWATPKIDNLFFENQFHGHVSPSYNTASPKGGWGLQHDAIASWKRSE